MNDQNSDRIGDSIKVLHIDDDKSFLDLFEARVERSRDDMEIISVEEPDKCLEVLDKRNIDCVISDYQYPDTTGLDLFTEVRQEYPDIPFVVLTGQGSEKVASRAMSKGVTDYFLKDEVVKKHDILLKRIENIVARRRAEKEKERVLERGSDGYFGLDENWNFTYLNETAQKLLGKSEEELLGENIWTIYGSIRDTKFEEKFREAMKDQTAVTFEEYFAPEKEWYKANVYPTQDGISVYFQDITHLKDRQKMLDKKARQQRALADLSWYALEDHGIENLMHEASRRVAEALDNEHGKVLKFQPENDELLLLEGVGWDDEMVGNTTVSACEAADSQASYTLSTEEPVVVEDVEEEDRFSGSALFNSGDIQSGISTIIGDLEDPWGILGTHSVKPKQYSEEDVQFVQTVANLLAETLRQHRKNKSIEESRRKYQTLVENFPHGSFSLYNEDLEYLAIGGQIFDELDADLSKLKNGEVGDVASESMREKLRSNYKKVLEEGEEREFEVEFRGKRLRFWSYPVRNEDGEVFAGLSVSHDMSHVKEMEEESKIREKALEAVTDGVYILDDDRKYVFANKAFCDIVGLEKEEIIGSEAPADDNEDVVEEIERLQERLNPEEAGQIEFEIGDTPVELRFTHFSLEDIEDGRIGVIRDISDRRKREKRLEEFGSLVSHDLRNPLNLAQGHLDLAKESGQEDDLEVVQKAHNRMESIIDELMLITMQQEKVEKMDVDVKSAFEEAFYFAGDNNTSYDVDEDLVVRAEQSGLVSIFENLISNSREHNEGQINIKVGPLEDGVFYYEDDGVGVDEEERDSIFDYGFTTSSEGRGLGMPIVKHISKINGWDIDIAESESGGFRIEFR